MAKQVELINKYEFAKATLDKNSETFVIHVVALNAFQPAIPIYLSQAVQVVENNSAQMAIF